MAKWINRSLLLLFILILIMKFEIKYFKNTTFELLEYFYYFIVFILFSLHMKLFNELYLTYNNVSYNCIYIKTIKKRKGIFIYNVDFYEIKTYGYCKIVRIERLFSDFKIREIIKMKKNYGLFPKMRFLILKKYFIAYC